MMPPAPQVHISSLANRLRQVVNNMGQGASGKDYQIVWLQIPNETNS
jgi:hypothetical protein